MSVSVLIPVHNHGRFLDEAIGSALGQTAAPAEVIVVDDGSTDETPQVLARWEGRVRCLRQPNRGVSAARNAGAAAARGDLLAFLDADDSWVPHKLERQLARFAQDPELGLVHGGYMEVSADGSGIKSVSEGMEGRVAAEMLLFRRRVILLPSSTAVVPRRAFEGEGGFDETLSTSADWDLAYRLACRYRVGFVPEVLVRYRQHAANMHANVALMAHDMLRAYQKAFHDPSPEVRRLRRRAYGSLHAMLAGSYFRDGQYGAFASHAVRALGYAPGKLARFAGYPLRALARRPEAHP